MSMLEADSGPRHGHMLLQILQEDMPLRLEYPPPHTHTQSSLSTVSSYLFPKSQLKSSILFQTSQLSPPHTGRLSGSLVSLLSPARFAYLPAQGLYHNDSSTRPRDPQRLGLRPGISRT